MLESGSLGRVGAVVDQKTELAVLVHDVALPMHDEDDGEVFGDHEVAIVAVADQPSQHALAVAERWVGAEVARAADGAIAQIPPVSRDAPVGNVRLRGHGAAA